MVLDVLKVKLYLNVLSLSAAHSVSITGMTMYLKVAFKVLLLLCVTTVLQAQDRTRYEGVNLAGAEFAHGTFWPNAQEVEYFIDRGMNTFRVPFLWERLQPTLTQPFADVQLNELIRVVAEITSRDATVIIDPHNFARYQGQVIGDGAVSNADFADLWRRLALHFANRPNVIFGLMNEPNTMPTEQWLSAANAAIAAIRAAGANNLVLVPGNAWTGAHSWLQNWYGTSNSQVMTGVIDPAGNYAIELHQYFDGDFSGRSPDCTPGTGRAQLEAATSWLRQRNLRGLLGEFAGGNTANCQIAIEDVIAYMNSNTDVWLGWTWWAAGPEWGEYIFTLEPTNNFTQDRPQLAWLGLDRNATEVGDPMFLDGFE